MVNYYFFEAWYVKPYNIKAVDKGILQSGGGRCAGPSPGGGGVSASVASSPSLGRRSSVASLSLARFGAASLSLRSLARLMGLTATARRPFVSVHVAPSSGAAWIR